MKISSPDLNTLFSNANTEMIEGDHRGLDREETLAKIWLLTVSRWLVLNTEYEFPNKRPLPRPDDED